MTGPQNWAGLLIKRDSVQGPEVLRRMVKWYQEHDGRADDFGRLWIVTDAERALELHDAGKDPITGMLPGERVRITLLGGRECMGVVQEDGTITTNLSD